MKRIIKLKDTIREYMKDKRINPPIQVYLQLQTYKHNYIPFSQNIIENCLVRYNNITNEIKQS
jgi:hypothetical protein